MNAYNAYEYRGNVGARRNRSAFGTLVRLARAVYEVVSERVDAQSLRVAATVASFVAALGMIGGMECGVVPFYVGIPLCIVIAAAGFAAHFEE